MYNRLQPKVFHCIFWFFELLYFQKIKIFLQKQEGILFEKKSNQFAQLLETKLFYKQSLNSVPVSLLEISCFSQNLYKNLFDI